MKTENLVIAGVGGQGNILASRIVAKAAVKSRFHVKIGETFGASQRGGSVISHVRIGDQEIFSPLIPYEKADIIVGLEPLEVLRQIKFISKDSISLINSSKIRLVQNNNRYPSLDEIRSVFESHSKKTFIFDGTKLAKEAGHTLTLNIVMLGALSSIPEFIISPEKMRESIIETMPKKVLDMNLKAFKLGKELIEKGE